MEKKSKVEFIENLIEKKDKDFIWILKENLKKKIVQANEELKGVKFKYKTN